MANRNALVLQARGAREDDVRMRVRKALEALTAENATVSFYAVAERAQVARSTLYRNEELKAAVEAARERALQCAQAQCSADEADALRVARAQIAALQRQLAQVCAERDRLERELAARDEECAGAVFCLVEGAASRPAAVNVSYHAVALDQAA